MRMSPRKFSKMGLSSASILWASVLLPFVVIHAHSVLSGEARVNRLEIRGFTESPMQRHSRESFVDHSSTTVESSPKKDSNWYSDRGDDDRDPIRSISSIQMSASVNQHAILQVRASVDSIKSSSLQRSTLSSEGFVTDQEWKVTIDELPNENDLCTNSPLHWNRTLTLRWNFINETISRGNSLVTFVVPLPSDCQGRVRTLIISLVEYTPSLKRSIILTRRLTHIQGNYRQSSATRMPNQIVNVDLQGEATNQFSEQRKSSPNSFWTDIILYGFFSWLFYLFSIVPWTTLVFRAHESVDKILTEVDNIKLSSITEIKLIQDVADESSSHQNYDEEWNDGEYEPLSHSRVDSEDDSCPSTIERPPTIIRHVVDPFSITFLRQERNYSTLVEKECLEWKIQASGNTVTLESPAVSSELFPSFTLSPDNRSQSPNLSSSTANDFCEKPNEFQTLTQATPSRKVLPYPSMCTVQKILNEHAVETDQESEHATFISSDTTHDLQILNYDIGLLECHDKGAILQKDTTVATSGGTGWKADYLITQQTRASIDRDYPSSMVVDCEDITDEAIHLYVETAVRRTSDVPVSTNDTTVSCPVPISPALCTENDEIRSSLALKNMTDRRDVLHMNLNISAAKKYRETKYSRQHIGLLNGRLWDRTRANERNIPDSPGGVQVTRIVDEKPGRTLPEIHHELANIDSMKEQVYLSVTKSGASSYCSTLASDSDCPIMRTHHCIRRAGKSLQLDQASINNEKTTIGGVNDTFEFLENDSLPKFSIADFEKTTKKPKRKFTLIKSINQNEIQNVTSNVFAHPTPPLNQTLSDNQLFMTFRKVPRNSKRKPRNAVMIHPTSHPSPSMQQSHASAGTKIPDLCPDIALLSSLVVVETQIRAPVWSFSTMERTMVSQQHIRKRKRTSDVTHDKIHELRQRSKLKASTDRSNHGKQERTDKFQDKRNRGNLHSNDSDIPRRVEFPVARGRKKKKV